MSVVLYYTLANGKMKEIRCPIHWPSCSKGLPHTWWNRKFIFKTALGIIQLVLTPVLWVFKLLLDWTSKLLRKRQISNFQAVDKKCLNFHKIGIYVIPGNMYMLAPRWNTPAQMGELYGVINFALSVKFPTRLNISMLDNCVAKVWDKELCTAPVYRVRSRKLALNPCGLAWPRADLTPMKLRMLLLSNVRDLPLAMDNLCPTCGQVLRPGVEAWPELQIGGSQDAWMWPLASNICFSLSFSSSHFYSTNPQSPCSIFIPSLAKPWSN